MSSRVAARPRAMTATTEGIAWSAKAAGWVEHWAGMAQPVRRRLLALTGVGEGTRFADLGCGTGELCQLAAWRGAQVSGLDAAAGMLNIARHRLPSADLRQGDLQRLPWAEAAFDVVTAVNALQFAEDVERAYAEAVRVVRPGGLLAVCQWSPTAASDVLAVFGNESGAAGDDPAARLRAAGLRPCAIGEVDVPYVAPDRATVERAFAVHDDAPTLAARAERFRRADGSYRLENRFAYAVARV
jgi:SAM-dependent methyltransferase